MFVFKYVFCLFQVLFIGFVVSVYYSLEVEDYIKCELIEVSPGHLNTFSNLLIVAAYC